MKRILSTLIICSLLLSMAACGNRSQKDKETQNTAESVESLVPQKELTEKELFIKVKSELPKRDYGGYEFTIMDRDDGYGTFAAVDVFSENENGEPINDAVCIRNRSIEETFNIHINEYRSNNVSSDAKKLILAQEDRHDIITDALLDMSRSLSREKLLIDLKTISSLDLEADCWDASLNVGLSVANKLYYSTGDISIMDNYGTWCIMFNKEFVEKYTLDDPYAMVRNGKWTYDKMYEISQICTSDLDGDGAIGGNDQIGFMTENFNTYALWAGSGEKTISKNENDIPYLSLGSERCISVIEKVIRLQTEAAIDFSLLPDGGWPCVLEGRNMFDFSGMKNIGIKRTSEVDFGILPTPKYDDAQENYYNTFSPYNCPAYAVPITISDVERTGTIMDSMAKLSKYSLTPAYMEVALKGKFLRDNESEDMIHLILANRNYDIGILYDFGGIFSMFQSLYKKNADFNSKYAKIESKAQKKLEEFIENINSENK